MSDLCLRVWERDSWKRPKGLRADVSGDVHHVLPLGSYSGISIVTVAYFLEWLSRKP
jgi:hypothetical protein